MFEFPNNLIKICSESHSVTHLFVSTRQVHRDGNKVALGSYHIFRKLLSLLSSKMQKTMTYFSVLPQSNIKSM